MGPRQRDAAGKSRGMRWGTAGTTIRTCSGVFRGGGEATAWSQHRLFRSAPRGDSPICISRRLIKTPPAARCVAGTRRHRVPAGSRRHVTGKQGATPGLGKRRRRARREMKCLERAQRRLPPGAAGIGSSGCHFGSGSPKRPMPRRSRRGTCCRQHRPVCSGLSPPHSQGGGSGWEGFSPRCGAAPGAQGMEQPGRESRCSGAVEKRQTAVCLSPFVCPFGADQTPRHPNVLSPPGCLRSRAKAAFGQFLLFLRSREEPGNVPLPDTFVAPPKHEAPPIFLRFPDRPSTCRPQGDGLWHPQPSPKQHLGAP